MFDLFFSASIILLLVLLLLFLNIVFLPLGLVLYSGNDKLYNSGTCQLLLDVYFSLSLIKQECNLLTSKKPSEN